MKSRLRQPTPAELQLMRHTDPVRYRLHLMGFDHQEVNLILSSSADMHADPLLVAKFISTNTYKSAAQLAAFSREMRRKFNLVQKAMYLFGRTCARAGQILARLRKGNQQ